MSREERIRALAEELLALLGDGHAEVYRDENGGLVVMGHEAGAAYDFEPEPAAAS